MSKEIDRIRLRRWRKRGFYSESVLVKLLQKKGYNAVRVPVSNPSLNPLPDIMARKGAHSYAFEVKNASYYAYFPKLQIEKLFRFLSELIPGDSGHKHAVLAAHLGKKWLFKEIGWKEWEKGKLPDKMYSMIEKYYKALEAFAERDWKGAISSFQSALKIVKDDGPSLVYIERCEKYMRRAPSKDWDGVYKLTSK